MHAYVPKKTWRADDAKTETDTYAWKCPFVHVRLMSGVDGKKERKFKKRRRQPTGLRSCVRHRVYLYYYKESHSSGSGQRNAYFQIICLPRGESK